jgi:hypothetical protein
MDLTRQEQETHVWGNRASDEWEIYTADPKYIRRLTRLKYPVVSSDNFGTRFRVPLHAVRFGSLTKRKAAGRPFVKRPENPTDPANTREIPGQKLPAMVE